MRRWRASLQRSEEAERGCISFSLDLSASEMHGKKRLCGILNAKHKIQSAAGPLDMRLTQVPKMLQVLRKEWAPAAFCVSFKLETDPEILLLKAEAALRKYQMHVVVANELATYKREVIVVTLEGKINISKQSEDADVEEELIQLLVQKHFKYNKCFGLDTY